MDEHRLWGTFLAIWMLIMERGCSYQFDQLKPNFFLHFPISRFLSLSSFFLCKQARDS